MPETKQPEQQNKREWSLPQSVSDTLIAGVGTGLVSLGFGVPPEYAPRVALVAGGFALLMHIRGGDRSPAPKSKRRRNGRQLVINSSKGQRKIPYEFAYQGYIVRETWGEAITRMLKPTRPQPLIDAPKPVMLDQFFFVSHYNNMYMELRENDVKLFLASAWSNRAKGKGLGIRFWVRNLSRRPAWYRELGAEWYFAVRHLIGEAQVILNHQLVVPAGSEKQVKLRYDARTTMGLLKYAEREKRK